MAKLEVAKRGKNWVLYKTGELRIDNVRGSYVHADKPYKGKNKRDDGSEAEPKFSLIGMLPKETHEEAKNAILDRIKSLLAENKDAKVAKDKRFIKDGDDSEKDEYEGHWTVSASESRAPKLRDRSGELLSRDSDMDDIRDLFQSGYWFNILIRPWYQDNDYGKRVNAGLIGIQFVKRDKTFGEGSIDDDDAWDAVDDDGDDGMSDSKTSKRSRDDDDDGL
jgi:hypothetical protein